MLNEVYVQLRDGDLAEYFAHRGAAAFHFASTACPGTSQAASVVSADLKMHGTAGLRVIDASAFPEPLVTYVIALVVAMAKDGGYHSRRCDVVAWKAVKSPKLY